MIKVVCFTLLALILGFIVLLVISGLLVDATREYQKHSRYYRILLNISSWVALKVCRVRVITRGIDKVPKGRYLLVCNHRSKFDPIISWVILMRSDLAFISKKENFDIPAFGRIIRKCCFMAIDREDPRKAMVTIKNAAELIKNDTVSVGVYPEGTRSKTKDLLPFHNGVFKIAQYANVPIVVMTLDGTEQIHENWPHRSTEVQMHILDVLEPSEIADKTTKYIGDKVYTMMKYDLAHNDLPAGSSDDSDVFAVSG